MKIERTRIHYYNLFGFGEAVVSMGSLWCDRDAFDFLGLVPRRLVLV